MYKVVGYYLYIHINRWFTFQMWLLPDICKQSLVSIYTARIVIHVEKSTYILQIKIKCYKSDVYRLPSYMSHVLDHVHTRIHSIQYLLQFSPYFSYKLYLNTVYKYSITIHLYMLPVFLHPKDGKKYMYFSSSVSGFLPYKYT